MFLPIYSFLLTAALALTSPWWLWRMLTAGRYREGLAQRLGRIPPGLRSAVAGRPTIWIHAVSVGEVLAVERLVAELREALPNHVIAISTTTATGNKIARERFGPATVFFFPLDFAFAVRAWLRALRPELMILVESEFWPRQLAECERAGIPVAVVNARISDRSFPRYLLLRRLWKPLLAKITSFLAQGEETADRLRSIGVPPESVQVSGNLKFDLPPICLTPIAKALRTLRGANRLIVAGSTHEGEEEMLLAAWPLIQRGGKDIVIVIAPRHPERFASVSDLIRASGFPFVLCSDLLRPGATLSSGTILLLDSVGDLASVYAAAQTAFIGGSLVPRGGHNPLEAARFGVPIVMGKSFQNFREIVAGMNSIRIIDPPELGEALISSLQNGGASGRCGQEFYTNQAGAVRRTLSALRQLLPEPPRDLSRPLCSPRFAFLPESPMIRPFLLPFVPLYYAGLGLKSVFLRPRRLTRPVLSIGSLSAGGAGKTPVVLLLAELFARHGIPVDILSRGYGRGSGAIDQVDPAGPASHFGDEPIEMARRGFPVFVGADRHAAGSLAESVSAALLHLLDDGFQHRRLHHDLDLVLLTLEDARDTLLPAGNLREPLSALRRADIVILREEEAAALLPLVTGHTNAVVWTIRRDLDLPPDIPRRPLLFCGIARPDSFFRMVREAGIMPAGEITFPDHHPYSSEDLAQLTQAAAHAGADGFLTTAKDATKTGSLENLAVASLRLRLVDEPAAWSMLEDAAL